jgi:gamma-glutamyl:cysteine ligase YbdK (ATP-grasp superfamily)
MNTDKLPTASLADSKTVKNLADLPLTRRLEIQETLRQTEARDWIRRYRKKIREEGKAEALAWWHQTLSDLVKRRGQKAVDDLRRRMNEGGKD